MVHAKRRKYEERTANLTIPNAIAQSSIGSSYSHWVGSQLAVDDSVLIIGSSPSCTLVGRVRSHDCGMVLHPMQQVRWVLLGLHCTCTFLRRAAEGSTVRVIATPPFGLVLAAYFLSRACIKRACAGGSHFGSLRATGRSTLGLAYGLGGADLCSRRLSRPNAARVGGVMLPIVRGICDLFDFQAGCDRHSACPFF